MKTYRLFLCAALASVALTACALATPAPTPEPKAITPTASTSAHSGHGIAESSAPFDAQFIDSMIEHHLGAVSMAKQAQNAAQRTEIKQLANAIIKTQQSEIEQMNQWRKAWYPDLKASSGMTMSLGAMAVAQGPAPYDIRFIDAMISHHAAAVAMAQTALQKAEHSELKQLAEIIIADQTKEIAQMQQWRKAWAQ